MTQDSSATVSAAGRPLLSGSNFVLLAVAVFLIEVLFASGKELFGSVHFGLHGPGGYWAFQWPRDYSHGFIRRGLLGEVVRRVGLDNTNYLTVTVLSWTVSLLLYVFFARSVRQLLREMAAVESLLLAAVLLLSPITTGMFLEITGDPLMVVLLGYVLLHLFLTRGRFPAAAEFAVCAVFGAVSIFIHEASLFFFAPAIGVVCLVLGERRRVAPLAGYLLAALPAVLIVVFATQHGSSQEAVPMLHWRGVVAYAAPDQYPSFSSLAATDNAANFGRGVYGLAKMVYRFVSCLIVPAFLALVVVKSSFGVSATVSKKATLAILIPAVCCLPLFAIAHDWGRFFAFQFILAITHLGTWKSGLPGKATRMEFGSVGAALVIAGITTTPVALTYRVLGLSDSRPIFLATVLIVLGSMLWMRRRDDSVLST